MPKNKKQNKRRGLKGKGTVPFSFPKSALCLKARLALSLQFSQSRVQVGPIEQLEEANAVVRDVLQ